MFKGRLEVPPDCRDPELWLLLHEYEFCRWIEEYGGRAHELRALFLRPEVQPRLHAALSDPRPEQRLYAGRVILACRSGDAAPVALRLLADPDDFVRGKLAEALSGFPHGEIAELLVRIAREDPSPLARAGAAAGLAGQDPLLAIPVLLEMIDEDQESDPELTYPAPGDAAASALDELIGSEFIEARLPGGVATFASQPGGVEALKQRATEHHARLLRESS